MGKISIAVVEDHDLFRRGIVGVLEAGGFAIAGEAGDGETGVEVVGSARPDVALVDLQLPGISGAEATRRIRDVAPATRVVILTASTGIDGVVEGVAAGAHGYLVKSAPPEEIVACIRAVAAGGFAMSSRVARELVERAAQTTGAGNGFDGAELSDRELEVLRLLGEGRSNAEIGAALFISPPTVKSHVSNILVKLGAENRTQAAMEAVRRRLI